MCSSSSSAGSKPLAEVQLHTGRGLGPGNFDFDPEREVLVNLIVMQGVGSYSDVELPTAPAYQIVFVGDLDGRRIRRDSVVPVVLNVTRDTDIDCGNCTGLQTACALIATQDYNKGGTLEVVLQPFESLLPSLQWQTARSIQSFASRWQRRLSDRFRHTALVSGSSGVHRRSWISDQNRMCRSHSLHSSDLLAVRRSRAPSSIAGPTNYGLAQQRQLATNCM